MSELVERLDQVVRGVSYSGTPCETAKKVTEEAKNWAIEIVSSIILGKCCCKNPDVECYFCTLSNEVCKKLEEE